MVYAEFAFNFRSSNRQLMASSTADDRPSGLPQPGRANEGEGGVSAGQVPRGAGHAAGPCSVCAEVNVEVPPWSKGTIFMDGVPRDDEPSAPHRDSRSIVVTLITRITPKANAQPREQLLALVVVYHVIYGSHTVTHGQQSAIPPFRQDVFATRRSPAQRTPAGVSALRPAG
jgi:hypothetical protein